MYLFTTFKWKVGVWGLGGCVRVVVDRAGDGRAGEFPEMKIWTFGLI